MRHRGQRPAPLMVKSGIAAESFRCFTEARVLGDKAGKRSRLRILCTGGDGRKQKTGGSGFCGLQIPEPPAINTNGWLCSYASAAPSALQAAAASSSGASLQITLSQASTAPSAAQVSSHVRIHSPSPQP